MAVKCVCAVLVLALRCLAPVLSCSPVEPVERYSPAETFEAASIVIYGQYVSDYIGEPKGEAYPHSSKHVIVDVNCTMKSESVNIPSTLTLNGNYMWTSCHHSELIQNKSYLMTLSWHAEDPEGFFRIFEPNVASVATFAPNQENFEAARKYCGIGSENVAVDMCPQCDKGVVNFNGANPNAGMNLGAGGTFLFVIGVSWILQF